ncbi:MAG: hypothetical protein PHO41_05360, partial [Eubacteriales bacterium]|nr:hypothetical protein [Eubacteriales bacterium]
NDDPKVPDVVRVDWNAILQTIYLRVPHWRVKRLSRFSFCGIAGFPAFLLWREHLRAARRFKHTSVFAGHKRILSAPIRSNKIPQNQSPFV